jgi:uncharacterized membrane protein
MNEFIIAVLLFALVFALKGEYAIYIAFIIYGAISTIVLSFDSNE